LLDGYQQLASDKQVWKAFHSRRRLHFATDGGLHTQKGTHGWVISTGSRTLLQCAGPVDGPCDTASSTRSELGGYASALLLIRALSAFWGLQHRAKLYWYCDSKAAISRVKRYALRSSTYTTMPEDADLLSIIRSCHRDLKKSIRIHWVKGHQDSGGTKRQLSLASKLNILANSLASSYRKTGRLKSSVSANHEPAQGCSIVINGKRLTSQYDASIRFHVNDYHLRQYLQEKRGGKTETGNLWTSMFLANSSEDSDLINRLLG
jgi:ribonuclease HI